MKRIFILASFLLSALFSFSQFPNNQEVSNTGTIYHAKGALKGDLSLMLPIVDTLDNPATPYVGAVTILPSDSFLDSFPMYMSNGRFWFVFGQTGSGGTSLINDTIYVDDDLYVTWEDVNNDGNLKQVIHRLHSDGLVSGGKVIWSGVGLKFYITPAIYYLMGRRFETLMDTVTLSASDPTNGRIDGFVVDTVPDADKITGTASATPVTPQEDPPYQILLATILINAGDTIPTSVTSNMIYNENVVPPEWVQSTTGTLTVDYNNTANPALGSKDIYVSSYVTGARLFFTYASTETVDPDMTFSFFIYSNGQFNNNINFRWLNGTVPVSDVLALNASYGFNPLDSNRYQLVTIPITAWNWPGGTTFNRIRITMTGTDNSGSKGFYLDAIQLQNGIINIPPPNDFSNKVDSVTIVSGSDYYWIKGIPHVIGVRASGSGSPNTNLGAGYRLAVPNTNGIKTLFAGTNVTMDSTTNANGITINSTASGATNANIGAGFRWAVPGTNDIKTSFYGLYLLADSTTNANGITAMFDSASASGYYLRRKDSTLYSSVTRNNLNYSTVTGLADSSGFVLNRPNGTFDTIQVSITPIDTAGKFVNRVTKNATADSFYIWKGAGYTALEDSVGAGGGAATLTFTYVGVGDASNVLTGHSNFTYEPTPAIASFFAKALKLNPNLTATGAVQTLVGLDIAPVYTVGANEPRQYDIRTSQDINVNTYTLGKGRGNLASNTTFGFETMGFAAATVPSGTAQNTAFGGSTLRVATTGYSNSAYGTFSLDALTTGYLNSAFGINSLGATIGGYSNSAFGNSAMLLNTSGTLNSAFGENALRANLIGYENSSFGVYSLGTATGVLNSGFGTYAGYGLASGNNNVAIGHSAMYAGSGAASDNTAIGYRAGYNNGAGLRNVYIGNRAGEGAAALTDRLFIDNSQLSNAPVIGADFALNTAGINRAGYTARWHLPAGTQAANAAPLKFTYDSLVTTAASGTGATATITFAAQTYIPFPVGSQITVAGVTPAGYNATATVTASTTTTVSYLNATSGAQTVAGTVIAGQLLTTPEAGSVERDRNNLHFTDNSATRYVLAKTLTNTATLDFGSTIAGASTDLTVTCTGAADGDVVSIGVPNGSTLANGVFTAWISAANTVTIRFTNTNLVTTLDPASGTFRVAVLKY